MKTRLQLDRLRLTVRGMPAAAVQHALHGLPAALARELGDRGDAPPTRDPTLATQIARELAPTLRAATAPH